MADGDARRVHGLTQSLPIRYSVGLALDTNGLLPLVYAKRQDNRKEESMTTVTETFVTRPAHVSTAHMGDVHVEMPVSGSTFHVYRVECESCEMVRDYMSKENADMVASQHTH